MDPNSPNNPPQQPNPSGSSQGGTPSWGGSENPGFSQRETSPWSGGTEASGSSPGATPSWSGGGASDSFQGGTSPYGTGGAACSPSGSSGGAEQPGWGQPAGSSDPPYNAQPNPHTQTKTSHAQAPGYAQPGTTSIFSKDHMQPPESFQVNLAQAFGKGAEIVNENLGAFLLYSLLAGIIWIASSIIPFGQLIVTGPLIAGMCAACLQAGSGRRLDLSDFWDHWKTVPVYLFYNITLLIKTIVPVILGIALVFGIVFFGITVAGINASSIGAGGGGNSMLGIGAIVIGILLVFVGIAWAAYFGASYTFGYFLIIEHNLDSWDAAELSRKMVGKALGAMIAFWFLSMLLWILSSPFCLLPLLYVWPWLTAAAAVIYRDNFPDPNTQTSSPSHHSGYSTYNQSAY